MNVLELKQILSDIPDAAVIYTEADHGQRPEQSFSVYATDEDFEDSGVTVRWRRYRLE